MKKSQYLVLTFLLILAVFTLANRKPFDSTLQDSLQRRDIVLPTQIVTVNRESETCQIRENTDYPANWPTDMPEILNIESIMSECNPNIPRTYKVTILSNEAYSYTTFSLKQDLKLLGWEFVSDEPPMNPISPITVLELQKDNRKLLVQVTDQSEKTEIVFIENY
jgi:hypothetical protein